ncbi:unnamed protein product, partial [Nesidiocoris tenuis]
YLSPTRGTTSHVWHSRWCKITSKGTQSWASTWTYIESQLVELMPKFYWRAVSFSDVSK